MYHNFIKDSISFRNSYAICSSFSSWLTSRVWLIINLLGTWRCLCRLSHRHPWQLEFFDGQCSVLGTHDIYYSCHTWRHCCLQDYILIVLVARSIEDILPVLAVCVQHTANISANISSIFIASNFLITYVGKLNLWANSWILSTSSSGVLLDLINISFLLDPASLKYRVVHGSVKKFYELFVTLHCSCFLHPMGPKKLSRYSNQLVSTSVSGIPWSLYQPSTPLMRSCNAWRSLNLCQCFC